MDYHKQEWEEKPVVMEKPKRGMDIVTTEVPRDLLDTMRMVTAKQQVKEGTQVKRVLETKREGGVETYHEGWVDGKRYLVPASNLEVMKDLVNLKVRRKGDSVFTKKKDYGAPKFETEENYQRRLRQLSKKVDELEAAKLVKKKSMYKNEKVTRTAADSSEQRKAFGLVPLTENTTTFLLSGHIREDAEPLFIIQRYKGKSPFGKNRFDFSQVESSENLDILISGNFYKHSILELGAFDLVGLRTKWDYLIPIDDRSKLLDKRFSETINVDGVDIRIEGDFIKQEGLTNYTPILTFRLPKPPSPRRRRIGKLCEKPKKVVKSISDMFERKQVAAYNVQIKDGLSGKSIFRGFTSEENFSSKDVIENRSKEDGFLEEDTEREKEVGSCWVHIFNNCTQSSERFSELTNTESESKLEDVVGSPIETDEENPPNVTVYFERQPKAGEQSNNQNFNTVLQEDAVVFTAPKEEISNTFKSAEPNLTSNSSCQSEHEQIDQDMVTVTKKSMRTNEDKVLSDNRFEKRRSDQGDAGNDTSAAEYKNEDHSHMKITRDIVNAIREMKSTAVQRPKGGGGGGGGGVRETPSRRSENTGSTVSQPGGSQSECRIMTYKCQVRPSKKKSKKNNVFQSISKLFSK